MRGAALRRCGVQGACVEGMRRTMRVLFVTRRYDAVHHVARGMCGARWLPAGYVRDRDDDDAVQRLELCAQSSFSVCQQCTSVAHQTGTSNIAVIHPCRLPSSQTKPDPAVRERQLQQSALIGSGRCAVPSPACAVEPTPAAPAAALCGYMRRGAAATSAAATSQSCRLHSPLPLLYIEARRPVEVLRTRAAVLLRRAQQPLPAAPAAAAAAAAVQREREWSRRSMLWEPASSSGGTSWEEWWQHSASQAGLVIAHGNT
jgi:hypothetical protein